MSNAALVQELLIGFGKKKQAAIGTANLTADIIRFNKNSADVLSPNYITEDDATEIGKGHEFATTTYPSYIDVGPHSIEKYLSSQVLAWAASMCMGNVVKTGSSPALTYTVTPQNKVVNGLELPYFTFVQQVRPGSGPIVDEAFLGCVLNGLSVEVARAPGRSSSKITFDIIGSGKITTPSTITLPAKIPEKELPGASLTCTIIGRDYVTLKDIRSLKWGYNNNVATDEGFFPGSGLQDGYAIKGRLEMGSRTITLTFTAILAADSPELAALKAQTTGTAVIGQSFNAANNYTATFQKVALKSVTRNVDNNKVAVTVECSQLYDDTNGIISVVVDTDIDNIGA